MCHNTILNFSTGMINNGLTLGGPKYQIVTIVDTVAGRRAARVRTTCPVNIGVGFPSRRGGSPKVKTKLQGSSDIA
jgi:hypothetical protein